MIQKSISLMGLFFLITFLFSCKKELKCKDAEKITGSRSILLGNWKYQYTVSYTIGQGSGNTIVDTIYDEGNTHKLTFLEKGKINYYTNNDVKNEWCTDFDGFNENGSIIEITIKLSNKEENGKWCHIRLNDDENYFNVQSDNIRLPYQSADEMNGQVTYLNYYYKE